MNSSKTLFVLRHAKSCWEEFGTSDFDRPLKAKGILDTQNLAKTFKDDFLKIEVVVSSPANRAIHTAILICKTIGLPLDRIKLNEILYETSETVVDSIVRGLPNELNVAMIVGHNPTFTNFANNFLTKPIDNLPTTGLVKLQFSSKVWSAISRNNVVSEYVECPKG
jgi:phosphohistidine phosphatase